MSLTKLPNTSYMPLTEWALLVSKHKDEILARVAETFDRELHGDDHWYEYCPNIDINVWVDEEDIIHIAAYPVEGCNTITSRWVVLK
jgi:hypothetical protein